MNEPSSVEAQSLLANIFLHGVSAEHLNRVGCVAAQLAAEHHIAAGRLLPAEASTDAENPNKAVGASPKFPNGPETAV